VTLTFKKLARDKWRDLSEIVPSLDDLDVW
jgi:hypothetical protein